jgi:hypothetical protein
VVALGEKNQGIENLGEERELIKKQSNRLCKGHKEDTVWLRPLGKKTNGTTERQLTDDMAI